MTAVREGVVGTTGVFVAQVTYEIWCYRLNLRVPLNGTEVKAIFSFFT